MDSPRETKFALSLVASEWKLNPDWFSQVCFVFIVTQCLTPELLLNDMSKGEINEKVFEP